MRRFPRSNAVREASFPQPNPAFGAVLEAVICVEGDFAVEAELCEAVRADGEEFGEFCEAECEAEREGAED